MDWLGIKLLFTIQLFQPFWNLIVITRIHVILSSVNYCIILILQCPLHVNVFDPWDVEHLLSLLENWAPASSPTYFETA